MNATAQAEFSNGLLTPEFELRSDAAGVLSGDWPVTVDIPKLRVARVHLRCPMLFNGVRTKQITHKAGDPYLRLGDVYGVTWNFDFKWDAP